ncbi:MAG: hypothetical protein PHX61_12440 [Alphaproteobacteria bacterium]|nr:hypothetical protein [Alphaproteobacteria bacterium]
MKEKNAMLEICVNLLFFALALTLVIEIMMKTAAINYQNTIKAKAVIQLNSIVSIIQSNQGELAGFYELVDSRISFDKDNKNSLVGCYYYIEIDEDFPEYKFKVCDRDDNVIASLDYEVAYEN